MRKSCCQYIMENRLSGSRLIQAAINAGSLIIGRGHRMDTKHLYDFVDRCTSKCRILVVGDVMLDKYYYGEVNRISPEAPVPVTHVLRTEETLGGAANVAHNLALLGCETSIAGFVGRIITAGV